MRFFDVSPPTIHQAIVTLEKRGLIARVPGQALAELSVDGTDVLPELEASLRQFGVEIGMIEVGVRGDEEPLGSRRCGVGSGDLKDGFEDAAVDESMQGTIGRPAGEESQFTLQVHGWVVDNDGTSPFQLREHGIYRR